MTCPQYSFHRHQATHRTGFTLVEMMVALTIALVLTVVALPRVKEGLKQNVSARTATMVKATFENARAQAIRTGRPFGVVLHRAASAVTPASNINDPNSINDPVYSPIHGANYCNRLSFVQMAFQYRGDFEGANAVFSNAGVNPSIICLQSQAGLLTAIARNNIRIGDRPVNPGDLVSLGELGAAYEVAIPANRPAAIEIYAAIGNEPIDLNGDGVANALDAGVRVWLRDRAPVSEAQSRLQTGDLVTFRFNTTPIASPMGDVPLPGKSIIDLTCSGVGRSVVGFSPRSISDANGIIGVNGTPVYDRPYALGSTTAYAYRDVIVMFNGSGQLDSVYLDQYVANYGPDSSTTSDDYVFRRVPIASPLSILISEVQGLVLPETISVHPERAAAVTTTDVPMTYEPRPDVTPNFLNTDYAWLTVSPMSGHVDLSSVANPLGGTVAGSALTNAHPELLPARNPTAADFIRGRLFDSRRLARGTL